MRKPIFILGMHKSGASLLRSLLDGHPQLAVLPLETHAFQHLGYPVRYHIRRQAGFPFSPERFRRSLRGSLESYNKDFDSRADFNAEGRIETEAILQPIRFPDVTAPEAGVQPYLTALRDYFYGADAGHRRVVEKSVEHLEFAPLLARLFPAARFILIIRNPYATLTALRRYRTQSGRFPFLYPLARTMVQSYKWMARNLAELPPESVHLIRYEALVEDTEVQVRHLAAFLELAFDPVLLRPTQWNGGPWTGNSSSGKAFQGISRSPLHHWKAAITPLETAWANNWLSAMITGYSYERRPAPNPVDFLKPCRGESLLAYKMNRLLALPPFNQIDKAWQ